MISSLEFYREQAASCAELARNAQLANERDKFLQAQAAWQALADALIARDARREARAHAHDQH